MLTLYTAEEEIRTWHDSIGWVLLLGQEENHEEYSLNSAISVTDIKIKLLGVAERIIVHHGSDYTPW